MKETEEIIEQLLDIHECVLKIIELEEDIEHLSKLQ